VGAYLLVGRDDADLIRRFERLVERTPEGVLLVNRSGGALSFDEFRAKGIVGTPEYVIDQLGRLQELGAEEVIVSLGALPFQVADLEDIELVGAEIAAALRRS
jgi:alkanesulfonate monooxygenase SsuD/methylene tetrahydromethanopterin reductase-like flavin-dependent oxidoreductase (luciferase family)